MTTSNPMTGEQLDELMTVAVRMQRDAEADRNFPSANFVYAVQVAVLELRRTREISSALAAENAGLKSNLMFWDAEDPEAPYDNPGEIAEACSLNYNEEFVVQVAAKMPNRVYRVCESWEQECKVELVEGSSVETPATDAYLAEVRAQGVEMFVKHNHEWAEHYEKHGVLDGSVDRRIGIAYEAEKFAAQLRKGASA